MLNLKNLTEAIKQLEEERRIDRSVLISAIESTLAAAYKRDFAKREQIINCNFDINTGEAEFFQTKKILSDEDILPEDAEYTEDEERVRYNEERHIMLEDAKKLQQNVVSGGEINFPLETKDDFGRIASKNAKNVILQKLREAERSIVIERYAEEEGEIVTGEMQRFERGNIFINLGKTIAILPFDQQIRGERFRQGERIRVYVVSVNEHAEKGSFIKLSRSDPRFIIKLFETEVPEMQEGIIKVVKIVREAGVRTKIAVQSSDPSLDPVGVLIGQRGVLINIIKTEVHNERIDVIEYTDNKKEFLEEAFSPNTPSSVEINGNVATVVVDRESLWHVVGYNGINLRMISELVEMDLILKDSDSVIAEVKDGVVEIIGQLPEREDRRPYQKDYKNSNTEKPKEVPVEKVEGSEDAGEIGEIEKGKEVDSGDKDIEVKKDESAPEENSVDKEVEKS